MLTRRSATTAVSTPGAGHDLHLEHRDTVHLLVAALLALPDPAHTPPDPYHP
ncbi:hypothetical protein ACF9IK_21195 [Kitasatospora hibisci]|uniref:hypothetical protein n=1 Tax=Kitasatospora hibisci TaxID=3369522 RepID=UPI003753EA4D